MADKDNIPWENIHNLTVYDTKLVRMKRKSEVIEDSIVDAVLQKRYVPSFRFQKDQGDNFARIECNLESISVSTADTRQQRGYGSSYVPSGLGYMTNKEMDTKNLMVVTKLEKNVLSDILGRCVETNSLLWEDKRFKEVLELSIKNLACDLTSYTGMLLIYKNKNYIFSESIGKILSKENTLAGKFSGIFLKENSLTIPKILFNDSIHRLKNCTLTYEENNMKFVIEGKYLKKNSDGFYNVDLALIHFEKLDSRIECKFTEGSYSILINKELNMPNNKFENRLVLLNVPHEKQNIENRVTITANGSINRFNKLRI